MHVRRRFLLTSTFTSSYSNSNVCTAQRGHAETEPRFDRSGPVCGGCDSTPITVPTSSAAMSKLNRTRVLALKRTRSLIRNLLTSADVRRSDCSLASPLFLISCNLLPLSGGWQGFLRGCTSGHSENSDRTAFARANFILDRGASHAREGLPVVRHRLGQLE